MQQALPEDKLLDFAELFDLRKEYLKENYDDELKKAMYRQSFSVITDLFRTCARSKLIFEIRSIYRKCLENETIIEIIQDTSREDLSPLYKRIEFMMMQGGFCTTLAMYFKFKSGLTALKVRLLK